jgi:mannose-6-phosphate isomerase-like protein (cupin superfamily)
MIELLLPNGGHGFKRGDDGGRVGLFRALGRAGQRPSADAGVDPGRAIKRSKIPRGSTSGEFPPHRKGVEEQIVVERGTLKATLAGEEYLLRQGDALYFEADLPHRFDNAGDEECTYYLVISSRQA